jgi:secondary thiamine-phosphate synthase enzyme
MMKQQTIGVSTRGRGFVDVTKEVRAIVKASRVTTGVCTLFIQHTSASLVIQENADPSVLRDLGKWFERIAPEVPGHLRSAVTRTSESIPVMRGALALGTWQAIYVFEHRAAAHERRVVVHVAGE